MRTGVPCTGFIHTSSFFSPGFLSCMIGDWIGSDWLGLVCTGVVWLGLVLPQTLMAIDDRTYVDESILLIVPIFESVFGLIQKGWCMNRSNW
jgi:hypothetical protein